MIVAGARCEYCGRVDTIPYTSDTVVKVMLAQKGWVFDGNESICRVCAINNEKNNEKKQ